MKIPNKSKTIKDVEDKVWWKFRAYALKHKITLAAALKKLMEDK